MNVKHKKTRAAIFANPVDGAIEWSRVESLLLALGCEAIEGSGSAVTFARDKKMLHVYRPHPQKEALRYRIRAVREFLKSIGEQP